MSGPLKDLKLRLALLLEFNSGVIANHLHNKLLLGNEMLDYLPLKNQCARQALNYLVLVFSPFELLTLQDQKVDCLGHLLIS